MAPNLESKKSSDKHPNKDAFFVVDLDNVLFDTSQLKSYLNNAMRELVGEDGLTDFDEIWQNYYQKRDSLGEFGFEDIFRDFAEKKDEPGVYKKVKKVYLEKDFEEFARPDYKRILSTLKGYGKVIIFTEGFLNFQKKKIEALALEKIVGEEAIRIYAQKERCIPEILKEAASFKKTVVIDDKAKMIGKFRDKDPGVIGVWVRYGYHKEKSNPDLPSSQYEIKTIGRLNCDFLDRVLAID